jgi:hypothetical protein
MSNLYCVPAGGAGDAEECHPLYRSTGGRVPLEEGTPSTARYSTRREQDPIAQLQGGQILHLHESMDQSFDLVQPYGKFKLYCKARRV